MRRDDEQAEETEAQAAAVSPELLTMAQNLWQPAEPKPGDYVTIRGQDTEEERRLAAETMRQQGCKSVRFETLADGRLQVHGYLQA